MKDLHKPRCPMCDSTAVRTRITDNMHICIKCGHTWSKDQLKPVAVR